jgi:hypothetical protein
LSERDWHQQTKEEVFRNQRPNIAVQSNSSEAKLELVRVLPGDTVKRIGFLSDADLVVFDSISGRVRKIIEIEPALDLKKISGIVITTHLCNNCIIKEIYYELENVCLEIVFKKAPIGSKKDLRLDVFEPLINDLIGSLKGCIDLPVIFTPHE